ncbi:MAG: DNA polymerase/3'-5' exonuclease PolX [Myxococcota bacterium]|jgi:DNA polymerase/3'-5' exonuclease PolX
MLADVPDVIEKQHHEALRKAGIVNSQQLYERIVTRRARRSLATTSAVPVRVLARWSRLLDLMQLSGIGPKMVRLMNAAGINTLKGLQGAQADTLWSAMRVANRGGRYSEVVPSADVLRGWIGNAQKRAVRLE